MPYTPPSQRSPASSNPNSPVISRQHSYSHNGSLGAPNGAARPSLPRSVSSTSYLQKHRRSPSISDHKPQSERLSKHRALANGRREPIHQLLNGMLIGEGEVNSESPSPDEDRGRPVLPIKTEDIKKLEEALAKIQAPGFRGHSPTRQVDDDSAGPAGRSASTVDSESPAAAPALSAEARKMAHSRSTSEIQMSKSNGLSSSTPPAISSDDSEADDEELLIKPQLLRKKSGELVKPALRPTSRRRPSSMPGTPTFSKAVHFNEDMEQVRHFLQVDKPMAVSTETSPVETYESETEYPFGDDYARQRSNIVDWEIKTANFPADTFARKSMPVRVERIFLAQDSKTLVGTIAVANLAFHKTVVARFTLDYWKTTSEVVAEYNHDVRKKGPNDGMDRFNFNIKLADQANLENKTLLLCVRYNTNGQEFWDNNSNMNYQVDFIKKSKPNPQARGGKGGMQAGPLGAIPRSRHSPSANGRNARTQPASPDDDFSNKFDSTYQFGVGKVDMDTPKHSIRLKNHQRQPRRGRVFPDSDSGAGQSAAFSTRYDFSASLSAALTNAQNTLGDRSGIKPKKPTLADDTPATPSSTPAAADAPKPEALTSSSDARPGLQSAEYNDLIQKYCFFGAAAGKSSSPSGTPEKAPAAPVSAPGNQADGATDTNVPSYNSSATSSATSSAQSSSSNSPTPMLATPAPALDGSNDSRHHSRTPSGYGSSRSQSPGSFSITARAGSPVPFQSPWSQNGQMGGGFFSEGQGVVASHG